MSSSSDGSHTSSDSKPQGQSALYGLIGAVGLVEGADLVVLPALASSLQADLNLTQEDVALLVLVQALCLAAASPVWAALADSASANRKTLMVLGAFLQGLFTCLLPTATAWVPLVAPGALNALAKASLRPVSFGLIAEVTREFRGSAFGVLFAALYAGIGLAFWASPRLATHRFLGIEGWRLPVLGVGVISILTSFVVSVLLQEPAREPPAVDEEQGIRAEFWRLQGYCKFPSFLLLFFQACIMCIPWAAMGYRTLFLKAYGFEDWEVTVLCSSAQGSAALGALCGGVLADLVARFLPIHGRPCVAQASLVLSFPLFILSFLVAPPEGWPLSYEMCLICGSAFVASWTVGACLPMLAELAPWGRKSGILAWQGALEGALGCLVTSSMEVVAPRVFGHSLGILPPLNGIKIVVSEDTSAQDVAGFSDPEDRAHVAKIVVVLMAASWGLCFLCYSMLHWSYPRDLLRAQRLRSEEAEKACALRS